MFLGPFYYAVVRWADETFYYNLKVPVVQGGMQVSGGDHPVQHNRASRS